MAETFGDPRSAESFMLPDGMYLRHVEENLQALVFPVIAFIDPAQEQKPIHRTLDYLEEHELWMAATIDASSDALTDNVAYKITGSETSMFGKAMTIIQQAESAGNLPVGSYQQARSAVINCAFEDTLLFDYARQMMEDQSADFGERSV